ncbi:MAG: radical SAM protein [Sandaracinaceae bacterium]|nr:radical SAM protein [Sandaracinaceae bacterium]
MPTPETFALHPHARFRVIDDEGIFVLQESGEVLVVNRVAAAVVSGVRGGASGQELVAALVERFEVSEERARQDVDALLRDLVAAGALVEAAAGSGGMLSWSTFNTRAWTDHRLMSVLFELTYACNLDCEFCYNDLGLGGEPLTLPEYHTVVQELADMGVLNLTFTGGEPLANKDFFAIAGRAREFGFVIRIKSNGHALRGAVARRLREEVDPYLVEVSMHGASAAVHDMQTRVPGSFERLRSNLQELRDLGIRLKVNSTLTRYNEHELEGIFAICDELGAQIQVDPEVKPRDNGDHTPISSCPAPLPESASKILRERAAKRVLAAGGGPPRHGAGRAAGPGRSPTSTALQAPRTSPSTRWAVCCPVCSGA